MLNVLEEYKYEMVLFSLIFFRLDLVDLIKEMQVALLWQLGSFMTWHP